MKLLVQNPLILPRGKKLYLPHQEIPHPLEEKIVLIACKVSENLTENRVFLERLPELLCPLDETQQNVNITSIFQDGFSISITDVVEFLTEQYNKGLGYNALNTAL